MRLHTVVRIREQARSLARKVRRAAVILFVLTVLVVSLVVGKNILLKEVGAGIHKSFAYDSLKLSYFPPALVIENVRSPTEPPALRARRVRIEVPYLSLLRNRKVLSVVLESPEVHIRPNKLVEYKSVAMVLASAQRLGVTKLGMVGNEQFIK